MHDVAEILASLYIKNWRYTVRSSGCCDINNIYYISDCILRDIKICKRGFLYFEIFQTEISFRGEHGVKKFIQHNYLFVLK